MAICRFNMCHGVGERAHAVPPQLHVEIETAADDVEVVVDQAGQHATSREVDDSRPRPRGEARPRRADADELAVRIATPVALGFERSRSSSGRDAG